jgi:hypothetical protein
MAGQFVQSVYNQIQDDTATVVFIIIGSDATQIRKRLSAHPFYKPECSIWCNELTVYSVRLMAMPLQYEYGCLMVRGYKTAETKKTAHLKNMRIHRAICDRGKVAADGPL